MKVRKGEVTGRWLFKEKLALVTQLQIMKRPGGSLKVKIVEAEVRLLRNMWD